ncbi:hypothetical protein, partial [Vibrio navarrensis]|uniref:hypothetical protein n=1 Tax=Vibrio navarrensis TaxID=29495 RepID=UPI001D045D99
HTSNVHELDKVSRNERHFEKAAIEMCVKYRVSRARVIWDLTIFNSCASRGLRGTHAAWHF